ncbi:hypothetical protein E3N88_45798 [Mikania micrantha]|uniref:Mediator of RNA polymerase II transcription subunit 25 n=1 Tax=Mikania micrantha TaxID=192012 RepID=A0A5N6L8R9_9ASTR|nr:hypothetical protein E3N88_45798 [Mikania micrantha]
MPEKKQLVLVVEATAALGPYWWTIVSDYLQEIITYQEATSSIVQLALVQFHAHGSYSSCLVKRSSWARNVNHFLEWLSCMHFSGGGFCDAAIAEGLDEVLMIYHSLDGNQTHPTKVLQRHCILVAASNPYPLPTPVYQPPNKSEMQSECSLSDAETLAKYFPQGKRNPSATTPTIDIAKNPHYLILISEDFVEACAALCSSGTTNSLSNQSPSNMELTSVSPDSELPPTSASRGYFSSERLLTQQPVSVGNIPLATVEVEPSPVSPMASPQSVKTYSPSEKLKSSFDNLQDFKPVGNMQQPLYSADHVKESLASTSALLTGTTRVGQHAGTMMSFSRMSKQVQGMQQIAVNNHIGTYVDLSQQASSAMQSGGELLSKRQNQIVTITKLEAYGSSSSAELQHMGKCEFIFMRALNQHAFLRQMKIRGFKWKYNLSNWIVMRLVGNNHGDGGNGMKWDGLAACSYMVTITDIVAVSSDIAFCLIGMLFPRDIVMLRPHIPSKQPSQQQPRVGRGTSYGAGGQSQGLGVGVGVGQGQVSSPGPKPKPEYAFISSTF